MSELRRCVYGQPYTPLKNPSRDQAVPLHECPLTGLTTCPLCVTGDSPKSYNQNRRKYHYRCIFSPLPLPVKPVTTSWRDDACIFGSASEGALKSFAVGAVPVGEIAMQLPRRASMRYYPRGASRRTCCCSCAHAPSESYSSTTKSILITQMFRLQ